MSLACPRCQAGEAELTKRGAGGLQCARCRLVFPESRAKRPLTLADTTDGARAITPSPEELSAPDGISAAVSRRGATASYRADEGDGVERVDILLRWRDTSEAGPGRWLVFIAILSLFATIAWFGKTRHGTSTRDASVFIGLVALCAVYGLVTTLLNSTRIQLQDGRLTIAHGPLPWFGRSLRTIMLEQIYCEMVVPNRSGGRYELGGPTFLVRALLKNGKHVTLLGGLVSADHALFVEQTIERALGIQDVAMDGELKSLPRVDP